MNTRQLRAMWIGIAALALALLFPFRLYVGGYQPRPIFTQGPPEMVAELGFRNVEIALVVLITGGVILTLKDKPH
jgi:hypothetical protein